MPTAQRAAVSLLCSFQVHRWQGVREFLAVVPAGSLVADLGCGNGKYFCDACFSRKKSEQASHNATAAAAATLAHQGDATFNGTHVVGTDRCRRLLDIAAEVDAPGAQCLACDVVALPYRDQVFDYTLSIAVREQFSAACFYFFLPIVVAIFRH